MSIAILNQQSELVPIGDLLEHPGNPNRGDVQVISGSIAQNGFYGAVIAQRATGHVLVGNHRLRAAVKQGATHVPVIWVDVDNLAAVKLLLIDNKSSDLAAYDDASLLRAMAEVDASNSGLAGTGYTHADYQSMIRRVEAINGESGEDDSGGSGPPPPQSDTVSVVIGHYQMSVTGESYRRFLADAATLGGGVKALAKERLLLP